MVILEAPRGFGGGGWHTLCLSSEVTQATAFHMHMRTQIRIKTVQHDERGCVTVFSTTQYPNQMNPIINEKTLLGFRLYLCTVPVITVVPAAHFYPNLPLPQGLPCLLVASPLQR